MPCHNGRLRPCRTWSGNAISLADTPVLDELFATCPMMKLEASGEAVGLPLVRWAIRKWATNIGAGRVVFQELTRINRACADGSIVDNPRIREAYRAACAPGRRVASHGFAQRWRRAFIERAPLRLIEGAVSFGVPQVFVHCFL